MTVRILEGDCRSVLATLPDKSVHCVVTSPPYFGLRDYGVEGQMGLEATPSEFVAGMVGVFREVRRVLRDDGTLWLNLGDSYNGQGARAPNIQENGDLSYRAGGLAIRVAGLKPKDRMGMPWRVALALQADGWWLRQDIIWHKLNPMPESVSDRPTTAHEYIFLLTKSAKYYYDAEAIKEPVSGTSHARKAGPGSRQHVDRDPRHLTPGVSPKSATPGSGIKANSSFHAAVSDLVDKRHKRSVWSVATEPFRGAHFATFPPSLIEPCILAGCPPQGWVLDPFGGAGTTGLVADRLQRNAILIELNPAYADIARARISSDAGMFGAAS